MHTRNIRLITIYSLASTLRTCRVLHTASQMIAPWPSPITYFMFTATTPYHPHSFFSAKSVSKGTFAAHFILFITLTLPQYSTFDYLRPTVVVVLLIFRIVTVVQCSHVIGVCLINVFPVANSIVSQKFMEI